MSEKLTKTELETVQQTNRFFENLLSATTDGIVVTDSTQTIILVNEQFCSFFGSKKRAVRETNMFVWLEQLGGDACRKWTE